MRLAAGALQFAHEQRAVAAGHDNARGVGANDRAGGAEAPGDGSAAQILIVSPSSRVIAPGVGLKARTLRSIAVALSLQSIAASSRPDLRGIARALR